MKLQEILNNKKIQKELDLKMRECWSGIPEDFKPILNLNNPYSYPDKKTIEIEGVNNYSKETITLKELNFLYLFCFVVDFKLFYDYERASLEERKFYGFPSDLKVFRKFSYSADVQELELFVRSYKMELANYIELTGRHCLHSILD